MAEKAFKPKLNTFAPAILSGGKGKMKTLNQVEMEETQGGIAPVLIWFGGVVVGGVIGGIISNVLDNWGDFKQGAIDGYRNAINAQ